MGQWEFYYEFKDLCEYYNNKIYENQRITKLYYEKVKSMSIDDFKKLCEEFINEFKYMPKVADFDKNSKVGYKGRYYTKEFLESFYD